MRRSFAILTLSSLFAMPVLAQQQTASLQSDFDAMVATERAFAKLADEKGVKEAFVTYIADDGILFRGGAFVKGKAWTQERPNPPFSLSWWPSHADIASSGDLGWTTGPYVAKQGDESGHGNFVTVWKKQPDGNWRFAIDFGNSYDTPSGVTTKPALKAGKTKSAAPKADPAASAASKESLLAADRELGQATGSGTAAAYLARLADDAIVLRGEHPAMGKEASRGLLDTEPAAMTSQPIDGGVSAAGDLGYTYGTAEWKKGDAAVKGNYMRIWEKHDGGWKVRVDVLGEAPPPPPPAPPKQGS